MRRARCSRGVWSPSGICQPAGERFARPVNVTACGRFRNAQHVPDLLERESFLVPEGNRRPLVRTERRDRRLQRAVERRALDGIRRHGRRRFEPRARIRIRRGVERDRRNPATPHRVDRGVVRDAKNPGRQSSGRIEGGEAAEGFDERVLGKILRKRPVAREANEQRQDRTLVAADDLLECRLRAPKRLSDQPRLSYAVEIDLDRPSLATPSRLVAPLR